MAFLERLLGRPPARKDWTPDEYWAKLEEIGWLEFLTSEQQSRARTEVDRLCSQHPELAYYALTTAWFDCECIDPKGDAPYTEILQDLATSSEGAFAPANIREEWAEDLESVRVSFSVGNRAFARGIPVKGDWMQGQILDMVNESLRADPAGRRFIILPITDQAISLVFAPPALYERAVRQGLIPRKGPRP